jgi:hypothetical protein
VAVVLIVLLLTGYDKGMLSGFAPYIIISGVACLMAECSLFGHLHVGSAWTRINYGGRIREFCAPLAEDESVVFEEKRATGYYGSSRFPIMFPLRVELTNRRLVVRFTSSAEGLSFRDIPIECIKDVRVTAGLYIVGPFPEVTISVEESPSPYMLRFTSRRPQEWIQKLSQLMAKYHEDR